MNRCIRAAKQEGEGDPAQQGVEDATERQIEKRKNFLCSSVLTCRLTFPCINRVAGDAGT